MYETTKAATDKLIEQDLINDLLKLQHRCNLAHQVLGSIDPGQTKQRLIITRHVFAWQRQQARLLAQLGEM